MGYKIEKRKINYQADHIIRKLGDFLLKNEKFFNLFIKIIIDEKHNLTKAHLKILVDRFVIGKVIKDEDANVFLELCFNFLSYNNRGSLLEYVSQKLGPFGLEAKNYDCSCRTIFVYNENQVGNANFDLVFFNKEFAEYSDNYVYVKKDEGEFIECKTDISTFINEKISNTSQKKLNFMRNVYGCFKEDSGSLFFVVTFRKNITIYKDILKKNNYEFISVIGGKELLNKLQFGRISEQFRHEGVMPMDDEEA